MQPVTCNLQRVTCNQKQGRFMAITLTILGSGTAIPRPDRTASSNLVRVNDETIIIDLGPGALHRLAQAGSSLNQVSHILITHFHNDHTSDLPAFLPPGVGPKNTVESDRAGGAGEVLPGIAGGLGEMGHSARTSVAYLGTG
ncbi:MAG: MBL fold metallo-hydrolase [Deltaproteobacteria bacterium]|nr:MBL fold metallo-hydrolase [Deltaproteobacteria bacterium]